MSPTPQRMILEPPGPLARYVVLSMASSAANARPALDAIAGALDPACSVLGLGLPLCAALGAAVPGLRTFPALAGAGVGVPSSQGALLCALGGRDRGELVHASREVIRRAAPALVPTEIVDGFTYRDGRDLTGYVDGTENPSGDAAIEAAVIRGRGAGLDGGSFVAIQRWTHDLDAFEALAPAERDRAIGRAQATNAELADAPASAHVKRSAQESFEPEAFMLRRSMPYADGSEHGLLFVAYGESLDRYERVLRRMTGLDDGVVDALFRFTRPLSGGYYFCPPRDGAALDLRALTTSPDSGPRDP